MYNYDELLNLFEEILDKQDILTPPFEMYEPIEYILQIGGKRLRPVLCLASANIFSDEITKAYNSALALEYFHNFTLLHDDIMDDSDIRRGKPTVHIKWNNNTAILSGDAMMILAYRLISKDFNEHTEKILTEFNNLALKVCEGQQYDMNFETKENVSIDEYLKMIKLKTAVLLAGSLKIGAISVSADEKSQDLLYEFGINLGMAFQLQDDFLDAFGDLKIFGKKPGNDIVANKKTFLLLKSLELADSNKKNELQNLLSQKSFDKEKKINRIMSIYNSLNIKEITSNKIDFYINKAMDSLNKIEVGNNKKLQLSLIVEKIKDRNK